MEANTTIKFLGNREILPVAIYIMQLYYITKDSLRMQSFIIWLNFSLTDNDIRYIKWGLISRLLGVFHWPFVKVKCIAYGDPTKNYETNTYVVVRSTTNRATFALDTLPPVLANRNDHVCSELQTSWMPYNKNVRTSWTTYLGQYEESVVGCE